MAWTQYGKACEVRDDLEKSMKEIVLNPQIYNDTYIEARKAREQWKHIEDCVRELEHQQQRRNGVDNSPLPFWPLDTQIRVLVAMRFFEWYFHEQGRVRGSGMGPEDMQQP
jgi:hypothetical protein